MKLLDRLVQVARRRRLADATIEAYTSWVRNYLAHCADRHGKWVVPEQLHTVDVEAFLNHLVLEKRLSASSQNQALNALVFLYRHVLENVIRTIIWESSFFCAADGKRACRRYFACRR